MEVFWIEKSQDTQSLSQQIQLCHSKAHLCTVSEKKLEFAKITYRENLRRMLISVNKVLFSPLGAE